MICRIFDVCRVHTRLPVVIPQRICTELLNWVQPVVASDIFRAPLQSCCRDRSSPSKPRLRQLRQAGATLLNQAVMLRGVNDSCAGSDCAVLVAGQRTSHAVLCPSARSGAGCHALCRSRRDGDRHHGGSALSVTRLRGPQARSRNRRTTQQDLAHGRIALPQFTEMELRTKLLACQINILITPR